MDQRFNRSNAVLKISNLAKRTIRRQNRNVSRAHDKLTLGRLQAFQKNFKLLHNDL